MIKVANIVFNSFVNDSRVIKESTSLADNGYIVEVIAHLDKNLIDNEKQGNFTIRRFSYLDRTVTKSKIAKLRAYFKYTKESVLYCKEFDILHCNDLNTLPIGFIIKKFFNKNLKIVYDAHEYETEMNGLQGLHKKLAQILEKFFIKYANKTITVSDGIANEYVKLYNIEKPALVLNTPFYEEIEKKNIFRETFDIAKDKTIFLYQGSLGKGRGIEVLVDAFKELDTDSVLVFMGYGQLEQVLKEQAEKYQNIYFHEAVSPDILLDYTSSTDFGISTIEDTCLSYHYCLPNKMFEYIMAEVPVIVSNLPEMKKIVVDNNVGVAAKTNTIEGLKEAITEATKLDKDKMRINLQKLKNIYNWEVQEKVLLEVYEGLFT
ncbi:MAG TPA: glycosyltransferase [Sulfurovum sp.]|nr:glycosyltransferase [Hydrogenothermaceae bacterium]HIQ27992.1 glycosyltransferase [Sulfurovum sp.]